MEHLNFPKPQGAPSQIITANCNVVATGWTAYRRPSGANLLYIIGAAAGGGGGVGAVGAASTAGGGGGGGSGSVVITVIPWDAMPPVIYFSVGTGGGSAADGIDSYISVYPTNGAPAQSEFIAHLNAGKKGGNAAGGTGGTAGTAGVVTVRGNGVMSGLGSFAGQAGIVGGAAIAGGAQAIPTTCFTMGGTGGGGLPASNNPGTAGGLITGAGIINSVPGGVGGTNAPTAGQIGVTGCRLDPRLFIFSGGTGGGSSGLSNTPTGSDGGNGGNGGSGSGGGGGGAAFTGHTAGIGGTGGDGIFYLFNY